jgi:biotin carboxyl carrier protein
MTPRRTHVVHVGNERFTVEIDQAGQVRIAGFEGEWRVTGRANGRFEVEADGIRHEVVVVVEGDEVQAYADGERHEVRVERPGRPRRAASRAHMEALSVPMPARVVKVLVTPGQKVGRGDVLVTLEAMKMEMPLRAPRDGTVRSVGCREGDLVQPGAPIVELT